MEETIRSEAFFVACFSRAYAARTRTHMNEELLLAIEEVRLRPEEASWFIPIRLDDCEIPDRRIGPELTIRSFQWLDMFPDWAKSVGRLVEAIGSSPRPDLLAPLSVFREIDAPWCPELVVIPPGTFMMGSTEAEREGSWVEHQQPRHRVKIEAPFAAGRYAVMFEEYDRFAAETVRERPTDEDWGRGRRPVINVSWDDAQAYVAWLSKETGQPYRLLSEAEWEYACRAGTTTRYWWGDDSPTPEQANFFDSNIRKTTEVGAYPPNPWGLYDMHGNVSEWVEDCWNDNYQGAPKDGSAWTSVDKATEFRIPLPNSLTSWRLHYNMAPLGSSAWTSVDSRVERGGSWGGSPNDLRSASRSWVDTDHVSYYIGFRVARTLSRSES